MIDALSMALRSFKPGETTYIGTFVSAGPGMTACERLTWPDKFFPDTLILAGAKPDDIKRVVLKVNGLRFFDIDGFRDPDDGKYVSGGRLIWNRAAMRGPTSDDDCYLAIDMGCCLSDVNVHVHCEVSLEDWATLPNGVLMWTLGRSVNRL